MDELAEDDGSSTGDLAFVLRTKARRRSGFITSSELDNLPQRLLAFIESTADRSSRIRAAVEAASILNSTYSHSPVAPRLLLALTSMSGEGLDPHDRVHVLLAKAMLLYGVSDLASSLNCIREATMILESNKIANTDLAMFHNGVGAILTKRGQYLDSISAYSQAHLIASRVGSETVMVQASSNLALSFVRVGEYDKAIEWANRVRSCQITMLTAQCYLPAALGCVFGNAMLGRNNQAEALIREHNEIFNSSGSLAISQAWALYAADGYAMMGNLESAQEQGWIATSGLNANIHQERYAGPFARWVARTSLSSLQPRSGYERLAKILDDLSSYDAIDRADIVNARAWLNAKTARVSSQEIDESLRYLTLLPAAVTEQFRRMGMLDFSCD